MKTLPDSPDLDHLRQQAKDLLAGLRDTDPGTSLATAQKALAEQYGFRGWPDLKAEDESGRRWSLTTDRGRWLVRTMDTWWAHRRHRDRGRAPGGRRGRGRATPRPGPRACGRHRGHGRRASVAGVRVAALRTTAGRAGGGLVVFGWEHAGGQPPGWELGNALMDWAVDRGRGVNTAGARALVEGYREVAGSLPALDLAMFRGAVISLANYVSGQIEYALDAQDEDRRYADRSMRHLLTHLPTRANLERLLDVAVAVG